MNEPFTITIPPKPRGLEARLRASESYLAAAQVTIDSLEQYIRESAKTLEGTWLAKSQHSKSTNSDSLVVLSHEVT